MQTHLDKAPFSIRPARQEDMPHLFRLQDACRCSLQARMPACMIVCCHIFGWRILYLQLLCKLVMPAVAAL